MKMNSQEVNGRKIIIKKIKKKMKLKIADRVTLFFFLFSSFWARSRCLEINPIEMSGTLINPKTY